MRRSIALIIALVLCIGTVSFVAPERATAADKNLLADATYTYVEDGSFLGSCTDNDNVYLNDGKVRGDDTADFNDIYGVPGTTVEIAGTGIQPVIEFTLKDPAFMNSVVLRGVRRSGNRYLNIVSIEVSSDGSNYSTVSFKETAVEIEGAPYYAESATVEYAQYFDVTATFNETATNVKKIRFTFNNYDPSAGKNQYVVSLDEIEAYGYSTGSYTPGADISLKADRTTVRTGDYVTVTATIDNITAPNGIVGCDLPLTYSTDKLELVSVSEIYPTSWGSNGLYVGDSDKSASPYWLRSVCNASDLLTNSNYYVKDSGKLGFAITFKAIAAGDATVTIDNNAPEEIFALVVDGKGFVNYGVTGTSCAITVSNSAAASYTVSYDANGGSGAPAPQNKTAGASLTISQDIPVRSGYTFLGWATSANATAVEYSAGASYTVDASAVLYAVWEAQDSDYLLGDVNRDGIVDNLDAAWMLKYDAGMIPFDAEQLIIGDVNFDNTVDSLDAAKVLKYDAGIIKEF